MSLSSKAAAWLALIATLCFVALVTIQVLELMYYAAEPSAWP